MKLHVAENVKELSNQLAEFIKEDIASVLQTRDRYTFVLSGGSTPKALYKLLASEPYKSSIPWEKIHFFWGDERFVPFEDERNNAKMAYEELLNHVPVVASNIHIMHTELRPDEASAEYTAVLKSYFPDESHTFDLVLLGMGDDGHTLSLFPGTKVVHEQDKLVDSFYLDAQAMYRITLTAPVVNHAYKVVFLAAGANKADVLHEVLEGDRNLDLYPSQIIQPTHGELHWFVDREAAKKVPK
jgi:6-phosphogluconolactonase